MEFNITFKPKDCLRKLKAEDAMLMLEWMHDETIASVFSQNFQDVSLDDAMAFIEQCASNKHELHLAICDDTGEYMGTISLKNIDRKNLNAEYAISTRSKAHGTGLAKQATLRILQIAFDDLGLHKVYLNVKETNERAVAFYRKVGFIEEGCARQQMRSDNSYINVLWFSMLEEEFSAL